MPAPKPHAQIGVSRLSDEAYLWIVKEATNEFLLAHWEELKPEIKRRWSKIADDDLMIIKGDEDAFIGNLEAIYRISRDEAERQYREFLFGMVQQS